MNKKVSAPGSMYPTQTDQWVWMILIGHWEVGQHRAGKQDHQLTIQQEQPLVSSKKSLLMLAVRKCHYVVATCCDEWFLVIVVLHLFGDKAGK